MRMNIKRDSSLLGRVRDDAPILPGAIRSLSEVYQLLAHGLSEAYQEKSRASTGTSWHSNLYT